MADTKTETKVETSTMRPEVKEALDRVREAVKGLVPRNHKVKVPADDGKTVYGECTPLATVFAGDVVLLCDSVPVGKLTKWHAGVRANVAKGRLDRQCQMQTQDLWTILKGFGDEPPPWAEA